MEKKNWKITAERMKERLSALNMTQRELAEKTGRTEATISRWTNGDRIPIATEYIPLAKALECTCDYLLGLSDDPKMTSKEELLEQLKQEEKRCEYCEQKQGIVDKCRECEANREIQRFRNIIRKTKETE